MQNIPDIEVDAFLYGDVSNKQKMALERVLQSCINFVDGSLRDNKVLKYKSNEDLKKIFTENLPHKGLALSDLITEIEEKVMQYSIAQFDQRYLAFPDTGNSIAGIIADIISTFINQNMIAVERSAPAATFAELQLINWLRELIGYSTFEIDSEDMNLSKVGGMWTSGGNMSNHIAMLVALHYSFPEIKEKGIFGLVDRPVFIMSKGIEHFSFASAANSLGIGKDGIIWVDPSCDYTTDANSIKNAIVKSLEKGIKPFMVVSVAGNCRTTNIDDLNEIGAICKSYDIWFHVDACHGGSLLFSHKLRKQLKYIENADSISLDPHKGLFVTYPSSFVIFKNPNVLSTFSRYPEKVNDPNYLDIGLIIPFYGSRGFNSFKLWALIKHLGLDGVNLVIEARDKTNKKMTSLLIETNLFIMLNDNTFYRQAFVFCPKTVLNKINSYINNASHEERDRCQKIISKYSEEFSQELYKNGKVILDLFTLSDLNNKIGLDKHYKYTCIAMAIGHPYIPDKVVEQIFNEIIEVGKQLEYKMLNEVSKSNANLVSTKLKLDASPASW